MPPGEWPGVCNTANERLPTFILSPSFKSRLAFGDGQPAPGGVAFEDVGVLLDELLPAEAAVQGFLDLF